MLHAVIMAGGSGTRFWPQSRKAMPKQLLALTGERTMIQQTRDRCDAWIEPANTWVVTNEVQAAETRRQLPEMPSDNVLIEPCGRNTAPCIGLAAVRILRNDPEGVMFVMPADHVINSVEVFQRAGRSAEQLVENDASRFVLFGVPPTFPATGYGYIERGATLEEVEGAWTVNSFREKPTRDVATEYVDSGNYYWNCGIFCWSAQAIVDALAKHVPRIHKRLMVLAAAAGPEWDAALAREFPAMESISIDYAVLERTDKVCVVEAPYEWDDVGSWLALPRLLGKDSDGNTIDGPYVGVNSHDCIVRTTSDHVIATIGVEDCIVVHTPDATLVAKKDDADSIRQLVDALRKSGLDHYL